MFRKILRFFKNKYIVTSLIFAIWMIAIDKNNMIAQYKLRSELKDLRNKKAYYLNEIEKDRKATYELNTNIKTLEKFAREKYLLKKDNEDIFLIIKE
ncbi:MAG: septum formation initiator family protein [Bacteroidetes bacterium]|nr:septum formation initiator family protein [Bacteroidota bacterium]